jgi:hypothetical protein
MQVVATHPTTPVIYLYLDRANEWLSRGDGDHKQQQSYRRSDGSIAPIYGCPTPKSLHRSSRFIDLVASPIPPAAFLNLPTAIMLCNGTVIPETRFCA